NQARLSSIYEKLQTNNAFQKWYHDLVRSKKDSREYSEKDYNKCKKHHRKPVDRNDSRCKIKGAVLEIVDNNNSENKILVTLYQIKYLELLNLLDPKEYSVQIKGGNEELKPTSEQKFNNTKLFSSFVNRLDYIVEFKKFRNDNEKPYKEEYSCCKIRMIFHRRLPEDFFNFKFEIEFNHDITKEKARKILEKKYGRFEELD
ncbi:8424_t:CDS:2, partial [Racocetra persica]